MEDLKELQKELDKQKWLEGEKTGKNMAGHMVYCKKCPCRDIYSGYCNATYQYAVDNSQCAKMEISRKEPVKLVITSKFQNDDLFEKVYKRFVFLRKMGIRNSIKEYIDLAIQIEVTPQEMSKIGAISDITKKDIYNMIMKRIEK